MFSWSASSSTATLKFVKYKCNPAWFFAYKLTVRTACENLVGYSLSQPTIFKKDQLLPIKHLKLLVRDYTVSVPSVAHDSASVVQRPGY